MATIEQYRHEGSGYEPLLIRSGWQFAQLNYADELGLARINSLERHKLTDEVFVLFHGTALLITSRSDDSLETRAMEPGVTYNIPAGLWHAIALEPGTIVFIVENARTHLCDVEYRPLTIQQQCTLHHGKGNQQ